MLVLLIRWLKNEPRNGMNKKELEETEKLPGHNSHTNGTSESNKLSRVQFFIIKHLINSVIRHHFINIIFRLREDNFRHITVGQI